MGRIIYYAVVPLFTMLFGFISKIIIIALGFGLAKILGALGIGYIIYEGFGILLDELHALVTSYFQLIPPEILSIFGLLGVDTAMNIIFTAYVTRFLINNVYNSFQKTTLGN